MTNLICHCFGYTREAIVEDLKRHGRSTILERIIAEKRLGACRCAEKTPKGA
jgi:hypothetical protein